MGINEDEIERILTRKTKKEGISDGEEVSDPKKSGKKRKRKEKDTPKFPKEEEEPNKKKLKTKQ